MFWMDSELHMPYTTALTIAQGEGYVSPINAFVWATGVGRTAAWNSALMVALAMDTVKEIDVYAKKGKCYNNQLHSSKITVTLKFTNNIYSTVSANGIR